MPNENEDYLNRRTNDVKKLWGMAREDIMALILVISLAINVVLVISLINAYKDLTEERVKDLKEFTRKEVTEQLQPLQDEVTGTTETVKSTIEELKEKVTEGGNQK